MGTDLRPPTSVVWRWLPLVLFSVLWLDLIHQLSYMWSTNEQYAFGWFVPVFALALLWRRWQDRPSPKAQGVAVFGLQRPIYAAIGLGMGVLFVARIIHEVNQDWALFSWTLALVTVSFSLYAVYLIGGWPWVKHFAFPIGFILVAVRWPYRLENSLTYRFMGVVASITVELLGWLGIPTVQHGNVIEVASGSVGVDEACSGIRSFQSSLMAALLMGELYRLRSVFRVALVGLGLGFAFSFNLARTMFLTWQADAHGLAAIDKWHDSAGLSITVACFLSLWAVALLLQRLSSASPLSQPSTNDSQLARSAACVPASSQLSTLASQRFLAIVGSWAVLFILATELWYRSHEVKRAETSSWWANFPTNAPGAREIPISKLARSKLKYDLATSRSWVEPDGSKWTGFCFRWNAGAATSRMSARDHRPEYCLGGSGYKCNADLGTLYFAVHGLELPFRAYVYEQSGVILYVFHCLWEDGAETQQGFGASKYHDRFKAVLEGKRRLGQQTLEIITTGYADMAQAEAALRQRLPQLITPRMPSQFAAGVQR